MEAIVSGRGEGRDPLWVPEIRLKGNVDDLEGLLQFVINGGIFSTSGNW